MHPMLNTAVKAARRAGSIINRASLDLDRVQVARKGPRDYVTEVDQAAEQAIIETLSTAYPEHTFLAEESGLLPADAPEWHKAAYQWIIDPLDGTSNFLHGYPHYAISIALAQRGQVTQAVIYDPVRNELFTASRGAGAFLNDRRIRTSSRSRLHDALIGARWPGSNGPDSLARSKRFETLASDTVGVRRSGSAVLDLVYVAAGRLDGFCGVDLKPWDMAAAGLMVLEAGGLIADFSGEQGWMDSGEVLAGSPKLFPSMLASLS
ncbi:inositol monophosphatase family protein [Corticimicrobacter populi]|uniref:Inositol-1-monophosphatase n=1 Tax=Corticimicrobacter populi TaxID=2175229 RepID=A0A2V1K127_9BURK|nr:inositol monophosphatase family protein [Corticimicrobacter populi]PWF22728.1 inositol monophosphatase [Corticimicrobacter populi]